MNTHDYFGRPLTELEMQASALRYEEAELVDYLAHGMDAEDKQERLFNVRAELTKIESKLKEQGLL
jgi:hypothetical protein